MPTILPTEAVRCLHRIKDRGTLETALRVRETMIHVFQYAVDVGALEPAANFMNSRTGGLPHRALGTMRLSLMLASSRGFCVT